MTRQHFAFECEGARLMATLDNAPGRTALLLVTGGNETRAGAWDGQAGFAARIAEAGHPVLRFDRRGVGDSEGENQGFRRSSKDIEAALDALRQFCPHVEKVIGLGNCDAATALALMGGAGFAGLVLSNPWTIEDDGEEAPPQVVRDHYRRRLADPAALRRLITGKVSVPALTLSLISMLRPKPAAPEGLAEEIRQGIAGFSGDLRFLVAGRDRTGQAFLAKWDAGDPRIATCAAASHSYVEPEAREWLHKQVLAALQCAD